jgi:hypothetical protein
LRDTSQQNLNINRIGPGSPNQMDILNLIYPSIENTLLSKSLEQLAHGKYIVFKKPGTHETQI